MRRLPIRLLVAILFGVLLALASACASSPQPAAPTAAKPAAPAAAPTQAPAAPAAQATQSSSQPATSAKPTVPAGQREVVFGGFGGSFEKAMKEILAGFEKEYPGTKVQYILSSGGADLVAKTRAQRNKPEMDIVWVNDTALLQGKTDGLFGKIDKSRIPNLADMYSSFLDPDEASVPAQVAGIGIAYNTKVFQEKGFAKPTSWNDLWRPEFKGRVSIATITISYSFELIPELAKMEGGSAQNVDAAFAKLKQLGPNILNFYTAPAQFDDLLKQGEAWIGVTSAPRVNDLAVAGFPVEFVYPKEGAPALLNYYALVKGGPNPQLANELLNYLSGKEAQATMAKTAIFAPLNSKTSLSPDVAKKVPATQEEIRKLIIPDSKYISANLAKWTDRWNREIEAK